METLCSGCKKWKPLCKCDDRKSMNIRVFKPMIYNDICETPILIESRQHLKRECKKYNVTAARLM